LVLEKAARRKRADGSPVMSFTRLRSHMATIVRNTVKPAGAPGRSDLHPHHKANAHPAKGARSAQRYYRVDSRPTSASRITN
jgi:hypothetical protein